MLLNPTVQIYENKVIARGENAIKRQGTLEFSRQTTLCRHAILSFREDEMQANIKEALAGTLRTGSG